MEQYGTNKQYLFESWLTVNCSWHC